MTARVTCSTMTIIVFLLDTSASMNQRTFIGARPTMLDIAKGAVETFVKVSRVAVSTWCPLAALASVSSLGASPG